MQNQQIGTMARYLNMHARAGVPRENVRVAGVVHGGAAFALLQDEHYREANGVDNPNKDTQLSVFNDGLRQLRESGQWFEIVQRHLVRHAQVTSQ